MVGGEKQKNKGVKLLQTATMVCYQAPRKVQRSKMNINKYINI
jgi:hypothetical protein